MKTITLASCAFILFTGFCVAGFKFEKSMHDKKAALDKIIPAELAGKWQYTAEGSGQWVVGSWQ